MVGVDIEEFYDENPVRRRSEEREFGTEWTDEDGERAELGWVQDTGELYLMSESSAGIRDMAVEVLAVLEERDDVELLLSGWEAAMREPNRVQWIRDRVSEWFERAVRELPSAPRAVAETNERDARSAPRPAIQPVPDDGDAIPPDPAAVEPEPEAVQPDADAIRPDPDSYEAPTDWGPPHRLGWLRTHLDAVAQAYAACRATLDPEPAFERALADGLDEESYERLQAYFDGDHDRFYGGGAGAEAREELRATLEEHSRLGH